MAGNKSGWRSGLFKKKSDRQIRMRAPNAGDSTVWKQGQVILGEYVVEGELGEGADRVPLGAQSVHRAPLRGEEGAVSGRGEPA